MATNTAMYDENQETVQFYKIKLMEREREISAFEAKMKKIQFKNNRDIKQLKMLQQKSKNQLKDERSKLDKMTKSSCQATEQNKILQHRMNQIKEQKDKEIENLRNQYNHLKVQVRGYERILPTLTFMTQLGAKYDQLPTYEEIFSNLKERSDRCENLEQKLKVAKEQMGEKIQNHHKIEQNLKKKKNQLQKAQRDQLSKMFELQSQTSSLNAQLQQLKHKYNQLQYQNQEKIHALNERNQQYQNLESLLEQCRENYHIQIQIKQEELKKLVDQYYRNHQKEIDELRSHYQNKENARLQQLIQFQEDQRLLHQRIQKDRQRHQQGLKQYQIFLQNIKVQLQDEKSQKQKIYKNLQKLQYQNQILSQQKLANLRQIAERVIKIESLDKLIQNYENNVQEGQQKVDGIEQEANNIRINLEETIMQLEEENQNLRHDLNEYEKQILILNNQIDELKNKGSLAHRNSFPKTSLDFENELALKLKRDGSIEQKEEPKNIDNQLKIQNNRITNLRMNTQRSSKSRRGSGYSNNKREFSNNSHVGIVSEQQIATKLAEQRKKVQLQYQQRIRQQKITIESLQSIIKQLRNQLSFLAKQHKIKITTIQQQLINSKSQWQQQHNKNKKKYELIKQQLDGSMSKNDKILQQLAQKNEQLSQLKLGNKQLINSNKDMKKQMQILKHEIEHNRKNKQKLELREEQIVRDKQKERERQAASQNQHKMLISKYSLQISGLLGEKQQLIECMEQKDYEITKLEARIESILDKKNKLEAEIQQRDKQINMVSGQLEHERKDRTLRTVPSLASLDDNYDQQQNYKQYYNQAPQKQVQIALLERQVSNLTQQVDDLRERYQSKIQQIEQESNQYIQQIIKMKVKVAESEMKASQKVHLYNQIKKKMIIIQNTSSQAKQ